MDYKKFFIYSKTNTPLCTLKNISIQYYKFAIQNPELYKMIIHMPSLTEGKLTNAAKEFSSIIYKILNKLGIAKKEQVHFSRSFRSAIHSFITLQEAGFFQSNVPNETSYEYMIDLILKGLINSQKED